jgi:cytochrome c oxidase subunit 4
MDSEHEARPDPRELVHQHDEPGHHHGHGGTGKYWVVFLALCVLTGFSFMTYFPFWHNTIPEPVSRAFMMAVSCTKALLVMSFFMHLLWEANWKYVLTIPAGMMSIFLMLMLVPDVGCRYPSYSKDRLIHAADPRTGGHGHGDEHSNHGGAHPDPLDRGRTDRGRADDHPEDEASHGHAPATNHGDSPEGESENESQEGEQPGAGD